MSESYKVRMADKGKRETEEVANEEKQAQAEDKGETLEQAHEQDKSSNQPPEEIKKSPAEEEKSGEMIGEQPQTQAEEILSEPILIPRNPLALIARMVGVVFFLDFGLAIAILALATIPGAGGSFLLAVIATLLLLKSAVLVGVLIRAATSWTQHSYYLTERQLIHRRGIATIDEKIYELDNIRHVHLHQDFLGRQFDFGHLELLVATAGLTETIRLTDLKNPEHFKNVFTNYLG
jgi:membrane protein YdbS with pleckstrin-like domain